MMEKTTTTTSNVFQALLELLGIMFLRFPPLGRIWIGILVAMNVFGLALFPNSIETQVSFGAFNFGAMFMSYLYQYHGGFTRLLGLAHVGWLILVPWLVARYVYSLDDGALKLWVAEMIIINTVSLVLDVKDVRSYYKGERKALIIWSDKRKA